MRASIRLGRIAAIPVCLDRSVLAILVIMVAGLAIGRLPAVFPGRSATAYLICRDRRRRPVPRVRPAHESGHEIVARRNGIEVHRVTPWRSAA